MKAKFRLSSTERWILIGLAVAGLLPIWRSGLRTGLNFYEFTWVHTVWGPRPMYIPREYLADGTPIYELIPTMRRTLPIPSSEYLTASEGA